MSEIAKALAAVMAELGPINKDERNKEQGFNFRSIEAITAAARPLLAKHNIAVLPARIIDHESSEVTSAKGSRGFRSIVTVGYTFVSGVDGSTLTAEMIGEAVDYGDKSTSKAVQMAFKYALTEVLLVGSGDDPDSHSPDLGSRTVASSSLIVERPLTTHLEEGDGFLKLCPSCSDPLDDRRATFVPGGKDPAWKCPNRDCQGGSPKKNGNGHWSWASWNPHEFDDSPQTRWAKNTLWGLVIQDRQKALEAAAVGSDIDDVSLGRAFYLECLTVSGQVEPLSEDAAKAVVEAAEQIIPPKEPDPQRPF